MIRLLGFFGWAVFLTLWVLVARTDWQHRKIRTPHLLYGAGAVFAGYLMLGGVTLLGVFGRVHDFYYWSFYGAAATHASLCAFAALLLWTLRIWPAGDAKLFVLLAALLPIVDGSFAPERMFLTLLINTFIPAAIFLFVSAAWYVFDTRLRKGRDFFVSLGWRRELAYLAQTGREKLLEQLAVARAQAAAARALPWGELASRGGRLAVSLAPQVGQWLNSIVFTSLLSYALKDFLSSPFLLSLLCMGVFLLWSQVGRLLGKAGSRVLVLALFGALCVWKPLDWTLLGRIAGSVSVFGFCMFLGMNAAMRMVAGGWSMVGAFILPIFMSFVFMAVGWVTARIADALFSLYQWFRHLPDMANGWRHLGPGLQEALRSATRPSTLGLSGTLNLPPYAVTLLVLSGLGAFFGLCLVLVRLWEEEVRPTHKREGLAPNVVLAEPFVDRLREDPEFFDAHFGRLYADGLTLEQAEVLKEWCARKGIEDVPVATTVSFASWIFLGAFLSLLLRGGQLLQAVL